MQAVPFIRLDENGELIVDDGRWWLVPHWAKELPKAAMFNARIEAVDTAPRFRGAFKGAAVLDPGRWRLRVDKGRRRWETPLAHPMPGGAPYAFAGLWAYNIRMETSVTSSTIITAPAVSPINQIHDRMPVILDPSAFNAWLSPATPVENLKGMLLGRNLDANMQFRRVSREVNKSTFEGRPEPIVNSL